MNIVERWISEQKTHKGFYGMVILAVLATIALAAEYALLEYGLLKIARCLILVLGLFLIAWIDGHEKRIPNSILIVLFYFRTAILLTECVWYGEYRMVFIASCFLGVLLSGGLFLFCYMISKGAMGAGDVKLMALVGYYIGSKFIFGTIFLIVALAAIYSLTCLLFHRVHLKQEVPFAPFVLAGTYLMLGLGI